MHSGYQQDTWDKTTHTSYYAGAQSLKKGTSPTDIHPGYMQQTVRSIKKAKKDAKRMFRRLRGDKSNSNNSSQ